MDKKVVLFVSHSSGLYGAERSLFSLVEGLDAKGCVKPVVLLPTNGPLYDLLTNAGIQVIIHRYYWWIGKKNRIIKGAACFLFNLTSLITIKNVLIKNIRPDIIYSNSLAIPFGAMISLLLRKPHIWHAREFVHEDMNGEYLFGTNLSMAFISKASVKVICNSIAVKKKLEKKIEKSKLIVIYNGFKFNIQNSLLGKIRYEQRIVKKKVIKLLILGSLNPGKGQEDAIKALQKLLLIHNNIELNIVGSDSNEYINFLKSLAKRLNVENRIVWQGFVSDSNMYFRDAAIVLICSRSEAFGRVAVEAMALGVPVIGTISGGLPEIIINNVTGLLYNPGDYHMLAAQIEKLITNKKLYEKCSVQGQKYVIAKFGIEDYLQNVLNVINKIGKEFVS